MRKNKKHSRCGKYDRPVGRPAGSYLPYAGYVPYTTHLSECGWKGLGNGARQRIRCI